jgi:hypothetical protein
MSTNTNTLQAQVLTSNKVQASQGKIKCSLSAKYASVLTTPSDLKGLIWCCAQGAAKHARRTRAP